jgi:hypothetical protein
MSPFGNLFIYKAIIIQPMHKPDKNEKNIIRIFMARTAVDPCMYIDDIKASPLGKVHRMTNKTKKTTPNVKKIARPRYVPTAMQTTITTLKVHYQRYETNSLLDKK